MIPLYSRVRLLTDTYESDGAPKGAVGYIIEVYGPDAYEVEFSDAQGITTAQIVARGDEIVQDETVTPRGDPGAVT